MSLDYLNTDEWADGLCESEGDGGASRSSVWIGSEGWEVIVKVTEERGEGVLGGTGVF